MVASTSVYKHDLTGMAQVEDLVVIEEPLEIRLIYFSDGNWVEKPLILSMRTPGHDLELSLGFLLGEGIISQYRDVIRVWHCEKSEYPQNTVKVQLQKGLSPNPEKLQRNFMSHSGCGVCGKNGIEDLESKICNSLTINRKILSSSTINSFSETLLSQQLTFRHTGGLHASALFDAAGNLHLAREDIGRHNSVDKVIGAMLAEQSIPLSSYILFLSSRISFELVQKALMAGIPILAAVGAPSSLAISLAERYGLTLIGFVREERFNVYCHSERIG